MSPLCPWADNPACRAIIADIIAERPDYSITPGVWIEGGGQRAYHGKNAGRLRAFYKRLMDHAAAVDDAAYHEGRTTDEFNQLMRQPSPNELIAEVLAEGEQLTEVRGDPFLNRRAA